MEVKEAVKLAKRHVEELFSDEKVDEIGLEETDFDDLEHHWLITIGFKRLLLSKSRNKLTARLISELGDRSYKVVKIRDSDAKVISVIDRILRDAA